MLVHPPKYRLRVMAYSVRSTGEMHRFVRVRQTGKNDEDTDVLSIGAFELFGVVDPAI